MILKNDTPKKKTTEKDKVNKKKTQSVLEKKIGKTVNTKKKIVKKDKKPVIIPTELQITPSNEQEISFEEIIVSKPMLQEKNESSLKIINVNLSDKKYNKEETKKTQIVIHHTASGPGPRGDIETYANNTEKSAKHFIVDRNGDIYQLYDTKYWSEHLGVQGKVYRKYNFEDAIIRNRLLEMGSISIELDSWGMLYKMAENRYRNNKGRTISIKDEDVIYYGNNFKRIIGFNGAMGFEKYTKEQLKSLGDLLLYFNKEYDIPLEYKGDEMFNVDIRALSGESGIWTHVSYKEEESDCHPDPNLILLLKSLNS